MVIHQRKSGDISNSFLFSKEFFMVASVTANKRSNAYSIASFMYRNRAFFIMLVLFLFMTVDVMAANNDTGTGAQGGGAVTQNTDLEGVFATLIYYVRWFGYVAGIMALFGGGWLFYNGKMSQGGIAAGSALFLFNLGKIVQ